MQWQETEETPLQQHAIMTSTTTTTTNTTNDLVHYNDELKSRNR